MNRLAIALGALVFVNVAIAADAPDYGPIPAWVKPAEVPTSVAADSAPVKQLLQAGPGRDLRARYDAENTAMMTAVRPGPMTDVFSRFLATHPRRS